ncbi:TonB-dependent receptor [Haliea sp. E17]|uniref:TonB-dependent receptor n=1 Tax=Haliea sp. E17 TaxID=3401576 RepID=UPI003AACE035
MTAKRPFALKSTPLLVGSVLLTAYGPWAAVDAHSQATALEEVIVTAQKRAQSIQDVPVAVTALSEDTLEANRVFSIEDISGLAPNALVRPTAGGTNIPEFTVRGRTSTGLVAGADKQVSIYLDDVYIGSARGTMFQLPDITRIEVLRGPQGTLFGRSATAGAVSITTRDPDGELGFRQDLGFGKNDHFRSRTTLDTPAWGPFSGYISYVMEERDGDVKNMAPGVKWDRTAFGFGVDTSPERLRDTDTESLFIALAFEPNDSFKMTYKYDHSTDTGTPDAQVLGSVTSQLDPLFAAAQNGDDVLSYAIYPSTKRPDKVLDAYSVERDQEVTGHSLVALWEINDDLAFKNITAYREAEVWQPSDISGLSGVQLGGGLGFCLVCSNAWSAGDQFSNETQLNFESDFVTVTGGLLYYEQNDKVGPPNTAGTVSNKVFFPGPNGYIVDPGNESRYFVDTKSYAAYVQGEFHVTEDIDVILGYRVTRDERETLVRNGTAPDFNDSTFDYKSTDSTYLVGLNYAFSEDFLVYGKYSTGYVPGGKIGPQEFDKEEALSFELGLKADFFNGRLRSNIALFDVTYKDPQNPSSGTIVASAIRDIDPELAAEFASYGTLIVPLGGDQDSQGVELELTALPLDGLTLGLVIGYVDDEYTDFSDVNAYSVGVPIYGGTYLPARSPEWNGNLSATYESAPLFDDTYLYFNVTGIWRDDMRFDPNPARSAAVPEYGFLESSEAGWMVNSRLALRQIRLGNFEGEVALWGRNLTDNDDPIYSLNLTAAVTANYMEERVYGIDFSVMF